MLFSINTDKQSNNKIQDLGTQVNKHKQNSRFRYIVNKHTNRIQDLDKHTNRVWYIKLEIQKIYDKKVSQLEQRSLDSSMFYLVFSYYTPRLYLLYKNNRNYVFRVEYCNFIMCTLVLVVPHPWSNIQMEMWKVALLLNGLSLFL